MSDRPISRQLADAVRAVNASLAEAGNPDLPELDTLWEALTRNLEVARSSSDESEAERLIAQYRDETVRSVRRVSGE